MDSCTSMEKPLILCIGNVLLDIRYMCRDDKILKKYNLKYDDNIELAKWQMPIFEEILNNVMDYTGQSNQLITKSVDSNDVELTPGGSAQNTARVIQWCISKSCGSKAVAFTGCVGNDRIAVSLENQLYKEGVDVAYMVHPTAKTGACAALITSKNQRSLCASIGASELFTFSHFESNNLQSILQKAKILYCEGFFITHNFQTISNLVKKLDRKLFCFNLSGVYVCKEHFSGIFDLMPYVDVLFGNYNEALALAESLGCKLQSHSANVVLNLMKNSPLRIGKTRIIIITRGSEPILVCGPKGQIFSYEVPAVSNIIDTVGAGDAFVAGFLVAHCLRKSLDYAVSYGVAIAQEMLRQKGCTIPKHHITLENVLVIKPTTLLNAKRSTD